MPTMLFLVAFAVTSAEPPSETAAGVTHDVAPADSLPTTLHSSAGALDSSDTNVANGTPPPTSKPEAEHVLAVAPTTAPESAVGQAVAFSHRSLTLDAFGLSASAHLGLVGSFGPTRFVDDIRFAPWSFLELHTSLTPLPSSLMARVRLGDTSGLLGSFVMDGGVAALGLVPPSLELEGGLTWSKASGDRSRIVLQARGRMRVSSKKNDAQSIIAGAAHFDFDVTPRLGVSVGFAGASTLNTPVLEDNVVFAELDRPGLTWLLDRSSGNRASMTVPLSLLYGVTESFDVDVFVTPAIYPDIGVVAGAGLRLRLF